MIDSYAVKERLEEKNPELMTQFEELQRSNKLLSMTEKKYRNLYQKSPVLLYAVTVEGILTECNEEYARVMGYTQEDIIGMSVYDFAAQVSMQDLKNIFERWNKTNQTLSIEIWCKRKNGNIFPALFTGAILYDEKGNSVGRTIALVDLTEIYKVRKELEYNEALTRGQLEQLEKMHKLLMMVERKYKFLYEKMPTLLLNVTTNGILVECNETYMKTLGYTREEAIGIVIYDHIAEQCIKEIKNTIQNWRHGASALHTEIWMKRKDGSTFPVLVRINSMLNEDGNTIGLLMVLTDMTEIYTTTKKLEEEKTKRLLAIGELSARIAHDIRNPLSVIKNTINIMKVKYSDNEKIEYFTRMERAISRISHQINEVLDYIKAKPLNLKESTVDEIFSKSIERLVIPDTVKVICTPSDIRIVCDIEEMGIVLANLITNAIQAMQNEGQVTLRAAEEEQSVNIEVEDTGPGIPQEYWEKIFDPLFTTRQIGTGLGLVSCKNIVESHGGKILIKNTSSKGTIFLISLPKNTN